MISKVDALSSNLIFWHVEECSDKIVVNLNISGRRLKRAKFRSNMMFVMT